MERIRALPKATIAVIEGICPRRRLRVRDGVRHALRRARHNGRFGHPEVADRHHPRRRRNAAPATAGRQGARTRGDPRLHGHRRRDRGSLGLRRPRAARRRTAKLRRQAGRPHRIASDRGHRAAPSARSTRARTADDIETGLRIEDQLFREALAQPVARAAATVRSLDARRPDPASSSWVRSGL